MRKRKNVAVVREPESQIMDEWKLCHFYNWYRINYSEKDAKEFLLQYVTEDSTKSIIRKLSFIKLTYCWLARILTNNNQIPEKFEKDLQRYLNSLENELCIQKSYKLKLTEAEFTPPPDRKSEREFDNALSYMNDQIDLMFDTKGKQTFSGDSIVSVFNLTKKHTKQLSEIIQKDHIYWLELAKEEEDVQEAYSFLTARQQKKIINQMKDICDSFNAASERKERKERKKKVRTPEEKVSKLKFKSKAFECKSVDLIKIIGAKLLYVVSDDKRALYQLTSERGFNTRSSFITNVDTATRIISYGKGLESCVSHICNTTNARTLKKLDKDVHVSRKEKVELKNNEYRSTDKFCAIKVF
jgi:hypothetical protein